MLTVLVFTFWAGLALVPPSQLLKLASDIAPVETAIRAAADDLSGTPLRWLDVLAYARQVLPQPFGQFVECARQKCQTIIMALH